MAVEKVELEPEIGELTESNIRRNIRVLLTHRQITAAQLAARIPMGESSMSELLTGNRRIKVHDLARIAQALDVTAATLLQDPTDLISSRCHLEGLPTPPRQQEFPGMEREPTPPPIPRQLAVAV